MENRDYAWTTDHDPDISHKQEIDSGAFADVHEVILKNNVTESTDVPSNYSGVAVQSFARKVIRRSPQVTSEDIQNELRAIEKIRIAGHENIVKVLDHGTLNNSRSSYFFDMELCDFNLDIYIRRLWLPSELEGMLFDSCNEAVVDQKSRMRYVWVIMGQIASGVHFLHSINETHRDLKPRNVLYSKRSQVWKIADFGLSAEGTSKKERTTENSRGTPCYRAPELLKDRGTYNNKADIWAIGCILYELVFNSRAFNSDYDVFSYSKSNTPLDIPSEILIHSNVSGGESHPITISSATILRTIIHSTLDLESRNRPAARNLCATFCAAYDWEQSNVVPTIKQVVAHLEGSADSDPTLQRLQIEISVPIEWDKVAVVCNDGIAVNAANTTVAAITVDDKNNHCVAMWTITNGGLLWHSELTGMKNRNRDMEVLPIFSTDGQRLAILTDPEWVSLIYTQLVPHLAPLRCKIVVPIESTVMAIALHDTNLAVISVRTWEGGYPGCTQLHRLSLDLVITSLCLHTKISSPIGSVRACFSADGTLLFVIYAVKSERQIVFSCYSVETRLQTGTAAIDVGNVLTDFRLFGTIRVQNEECAVVGVSFHSQRRRILPRGETQSTERLYVVSPSCVYVIILDDSKGEHQIRRVTIENGTLISLQWNSFRSILNVKHWDPEKTAFVSRAEVDGSVPSLASDLAGIGITKDGVTWINRNKQFSLSRVRPSST